MSEKEKTVEVTLLKEHWHNGVRYSKGDVIEVGVSLVPRLEDFKVLVPDSIRAPGTQKAQAEAEAEAARKQMDARIAAAANAVSTAEAPVNVGAAESKPTASTTVKAGTGSKENS